LSSLRLTDSSSRLRLRVEVASTKPSSTSSAVVSMRSPSKNFYRRGNLSSLRASQATN
jgi:hypothetical protein